MFRATNLFLNHFPIDFSSRDIIIPGQRDIKITFIISQIQIDLSAIVKDINFPLIPIFKTIVLLDDWSNNLTMFRGSYRSSIDVHIRVDFNSSDFKPNRLQEQPRRWSWKFQTNQSFRDEKESVVPMTPFPMPLTTPPDTSMNLVMAGKMSMRMWIYVDRDQALKKICRF